MSESKFSKGPWFVTDFKMNQGYRVGQKGHYMSIADTARSKKGFYGAHLIAAAPEMYELLKYVEDELSSSVGEYSYNKELHDAVGRVLAKARGEG